MWICPKCEASNKGPVCDICGEAKPLSKRQLKKLEAQKGKPKKNAPAKKKKPFWFWLVWGVVIAAVAVGLFFVIKEALHEDTIESVIAEAKEVLANVDNVNMMAVRIIDMNAGDEHIVSENLVNMKIDVKNKTRHMIVANSNGETQDEMQAYVKLGTPPVYYMGNGNAWIKMDNLPAESLGNIDPSGEIAHDWDVFFDAAIDSGMSTMTVEDTYGFKCFVIRGQAFINNLESAKQFGADSYVYEIAQQYYKETGGVNSVDSYAEGLSTALGPAFFEIYIDYNTYEPLTCKVDLTRSVSAMYLKVGGAYGDMKVNSAVYSMGFSSFNEVGDVIIPVNVLSAPKSSDVIEKMPKKEE